MEDLFSSNKKDFRFVRLNERDAKNLSDHLSYFKDLVSANEEMYPGIDKWVDHKVIPGLKSSERVAFVGYLEENPVISAVVKRGKHSKFCHLRISDDLQDMHLGELFFSLMALEVRHEAEEIHFTLPESLWEAEREFFHSFGFNEATAAETQYRLFDTELRCSSSFSAVWKAVLDRLPKIADIFSVGGYSMHNGLLMSIQPEYADRLLSGEKRVEIRRKFSTKWAGQKVSLYASSPSNALVGEAMIDRVVVGEPERIWAEFNSETDCTKEEFDKYTESAKEIYAIVFHEVLPYKEKIFLTQVSHLLNKDLTPPQSYCTLENNKPWVEAVSIAALLHGSFRITEPLNLQYN